ncbi:MAG: PDZ domain-containing protein [Simkania sp.]|nr:PDZ domain-containing protein [Simkania sp.]
MIKRSPIAKIVTLFLFFFSVGYATPPSLSPRDTRVKIEEILRAHVSHQKLTPEIVQRAFLNFLDELDPGKTYFLDSEIAPWITPTQEMLATTLEAMKQENYSSFENILDVMTTAINRRNELENQLSKETLLQNVNPQEFKDVSWVNSQETLYERLLKIRSLQLEATVKLSPEAAEQFLKRVDKRRLKREAEFNPVSKTERQQFLLSVVLKAVSAALDSQTNYFTPSEANQFMIQVQQRLFGIGAQLKDDLNGFTIIRLLEGGPALLSNKLKIGDRIIAVNHEPVVGLEITEAVELIRGTQGSSVVLTILRPSSQEASKEEEKLNIEIIRGEVVLKETRFEKKLEAFGDGAIAYLHLFSFYQDQSSSSADDLRSALKEMQEKTSLKGVILDLRNNAGGLLPQAVAVTGLFISKGVVVSVKDNTGLIQHLRNLEEKPAWDGPLIVLVNRLSASAAEIVAQTLQDYGRAILIGDEKTYGKGTFQTFTLETNHYGKINPKGEYKVTRGRYYTVSGKSPQLVGVQSDIVVPGPFSKMKIGEEFSKYPLDNESISASFQDDLTDIPPFHRFQFGRAYKDHLQPVLTTYHSVLPLLKKNSEERIANCPAYQKLLKDFEDEDMAYETFETFNHNDLQLQETFNILKDLLFIQEKTLLEPQNTSAA